MGSYLCPRSRVWALLIGTRARPDVVTGLPTRGTLSCAHARAVLEDRVSERRDLTPGKRNIGNPLGSLNATAWPRPMICSSVQADVLGVSFAGPVLLRPRAWCRLRAATGAGDSGPIWKRSRKLGKKIVASTGLDERGRERRWRARHSGTVKRGAFETLSSIGSLALDLLRSVQPNRVV